MKWIFKYLKCTFILCFENSKHVLYGYTNTDIVDNGDSKKSILGYLMTFAREQFHGNGGYKIYCIIHYKR
jgi:hypothetical protein